MRYRQISLQDSSDTSVPVVGSIAASAEVLAISTAPPPHGNPLLCEKLQRGPRQPQSLCPRGVPLRFSADRRAEQARTAQIGR